MHFKDLQKSQIDRQSKIICPFLLALIAITFLGTPLSWLACLNFLNQKS